MWSQFIKTCLLALVATLCVPLILWTIAGFFGAFSWYLDLFSHFRLQYAGGLLLAAVPLLLLRQRVLCLVATVFAVVNLVAMGPQLVVVRKHADDAPDLRLILSNVNVTNTRQEKLLGLLTDTDPDLILLEEIDSAWVDALGKLDEKYPYSVVAPLRTTYGIGLWSRLPLRSSEVVYFVHQGFPSIVAEIDVAGRPVVLVGTHPIPPRDESRADLRDRQLQALAAFTRRKGRAVIVVGDLNTTPWGHSFRELLRDSGLRDSSRGRGFQWSWPAGLFPLALPIDHLLVGEGVVVTGRWMGPNIGSDHYPLIADLHIVR